MENSLKFFFKHSAMVGLGCYTSETYRAQHQSQKGLIELSTITIKKQLAGIQ